MTEPSREPVVVGRSVVKTFGATRAVDGIDFEVGRGECFGMLGPNGAGKTSTVRMVHGASPLTSGDIRVFGLDVRIHSSSIRKLTGVCHQEDNLDPDFTVLKNLLVWARYFGIPRPEALSRAEELLAFLGLEDRKGSPIVQLSGGMKRRLVLARSLMNAPRLLILDEPTTGLDPQARHQVWERIQSLARAGTTILLTTHYMEEAAHLCDRLVIMDHGRIVAHGAPADLVKREIGAAVVEVNAPAAALSRHAAEAGWRAETHGNVLRIQTDDPEGIYRAVVSRFAPVEASIRMATLEDVFLKLTGRDLRE